MAGFDKEIFHVRIKLLEPLLGTIPCSQSIWTEHIAKKQTVKMTKEGMDETEITAILENDLTDLPATGWTGPYRHWSMELAAPPGARTRMG